MTKDIKISPIFYMGNKKKLIKKGLIELFPKKIHNFYDCFSGSGIVSMNVEAEKYTLNDIDKHLIEFYEMFKKRECKDIIKEVEKNILKFEMIQERTKKNPELREKQKIKYNKLRDYCNVTKKIEDLYTCMFFGFSQQFRFNKKGEYNMPVGNDVFSEKNKEYIKNGCEFFSKKEVVLNNLDFRDIDLNFLSSQDFFYLDPPYTNTTATYSENSGWSTDKDKELFKFIEEINSKGVKWGMSNVFSCKGKTNNHLIDWCKKNKWNVHTFEKFSYTACGKGNSKAVEVFVCNYEV